MTHIPEAIESTDPFIVDTDDGDRMKEACGVFGIVAPNADVARLAYFALFSLQHRGQEGAGICSYDSQTAHLHKGLGLVSQVFDEDNLATLHGASAIGHTRYSTTGAVTLRNTQPYVLETIDGPIAIAHNGNLVNAPQLRRELLERGVGLTSSSDTEVLLHMIAGAGSFAPRGADVATRIRTTMALAEGAYALTILAPDAVYGVRDPWGMRPLVLGRVAEGYVLASETCAFAAIGADFVREIAAGEIVRITPEGYEILPGAPARSASFCTFEEIYFARPDSIFRGRLVHHLRQALGRQLAIEAPAAADIVISVPDSGTPHAVGFAQQLGVPFTEGLIKNRYIGRTFIEPTPELRKNRVAMKFNPLPANLEGKRVVLVDDSIVRGTTSGPLVALLRKAGAVEVHVRVACPPIAHPCFMGVDMATREELIAATHSVEEIRAHIGADSLAYLSLDGLGKALDADGYCNACFTGVYPFASVPVSIGTKAGFVSVFG